MSKIISKSDSNKIRNLRSQAPETDWMCEGADGSQLVFLNNTEDKLFYVDYYGNITANPDNVIITPVLKKFIDIETEIARICYL